MDDMEMVYSGAGVSVGTEALTAQPTTAVRPQSVLHAAAPRLASSPAQAPAARPPIVYPAPAPRRATDVPTAPPVRRTP